MIVTPYPKANTIKETTCSLSTGGLLFGTNMIIYRILVLLDFMQSYHS